MDKFLTTEPKAWKETVMQDDDNEVLSVYLFTGLICIEMDNRYTGNEMLFTPNEAREIAHELLRLVALVDNNTNGVDE